MKISELIDKLREIQDKEGDLPVFIYNSQYGDREARPSTDESCRGEECVYL